MKKCCFFCVFLLLLGLAVPSLSASEQPRQERAFFVAPDGSDSGDGSIAHPFATLEQARNALRRHRETYGLPAGGWTIYLREGSYPLSQTFSLTEQDSGTADAPIVYRAYPGEHATVSGGAIMDAAVFRPVSGAMKNALRSEDAKNKVVAVSLSDLGISLDGVSINNNEYIKAPMFLFDDQPMHLAQWPNSDEVKDWPRATAVNLGETKRYGTEQGRGATQIRTAETIPGTWSLCPEQRIWLSYLRYEWFAEYFRADFDNGLITAAEMTRYGAESGAFTDSSGNFYQPFKVLNVYEEMDAPGEWYLDTTTQTLYLYPYETQTEHPLIKVPMLDDHLVTLKNAQYLTFSGIEFTCGRKNAIYASASHHILVNACDLNTFENIAADLCGGDCNGISDTTVSDCGVGGVMIGGGDPATLRHGNSFVRDCTLHDWSLLRSSDAYGIYLEGVGCTADHNELYNAPHGCIHLEGSEHLVEYNSIHDAVKNFGDAGAIYSGRSLAWHGTVIRNNYFDRIGDSTADRRSSSTAIYIDDGVGDVEITSNIFGPEVNTGEAIRFHGGMGNKVLYNLFVDTPQMLYLINWDDARYIGAVTGNYPPYQDMSAALSGTWKTIRGNELYYQKWPWLRRLETVTEDTFVYEKHQVAGNVMLHFCQPAADDPIMIYRLYNNYRRSDFLAGEETNQIFTGSSGKALLQDFEGGNYALTEFAYQTIRSGVPEFPTISPEAIGPHQRAAYRAPQIRNLTVLRQGNEIAASYEFLDFEGAFEGNSEYRWFVGDTADGVFTGIGDAHSRTCPLPARAYVKVEVTPINSNGLKGEPICSEAIPVPVMQDRMTMISDGKNFSVSVSGDHSRMGKLVVAQYEQNKMLECRIFSPEKGEKAEGAFASVGKIRAFWWNQCKPFCADVSCVPLMTDDFHALPYGEIAFSALGSCFGTPNNPKMIGGGTVTIEGFSAANGNATIVRAFGKEKALALGSINGAYPTLTYRLSQPASGEDITVSADLDIGDGKCYLRPIFTDRSGSVSKKINYFMIMAPTGAQSIQLYYNYAPNPVNNDATFLDFGNRPVHIELHFNMEQCTYWAELTDLSTGEKTKVAEHPLPTSQNGSGTYTEFYRDITALKGVEIAMFATGSTNSFSGGDRPGTLADVRILQNN